MSISFHPSEYTLANINAITLSGNCKLRCWEIPNEFGRIQGGTLKLLPAFLEELPSQETLKTVFSDVSFLPLVNAALKKRINVPLHTVTNLEMPNHISLWTVVPHRSFSEQQVKAKFYEGGSKIWESSWDLVKYILAENLNFNQCKILELGCGHGIPGIVALLKGATSVVFQDLNPGVLAHVTVPNVILNTTFYQDFSHGECDPLMTRNKKASRCLQQSFCGHGSIAAILRCSSTIENGMTLVHSSDGKALFDENVYQIENNDYEIKKNSCKMRNAAILKFNETQCDQTLFTEGTLSKHCLFVSCAWEEFAESISKITTESPFYDYILCSEALYRFENYPILVDVLHSCLKVGGVALFAAKRYYFGLDGGILSFKQYVTEHCSLTSTQNQSSSIYHNPTHYLQATIVLSFADSHSNIRDILMIQKAAMAL